MMKSKKGTSGSFQELISAELGGFVNQFLEIPNRQENEKENRITLGNFFKSAPMG